MGAWNHLESRLRALFGREIRYAGRRASASPATGALAIHTLEQNQLLASAFALPKTPTPVGAVVPESAKPGAKQNNRPSQTSKSSGKPRSAAAKNKYAKAKLSSVSSRKRNRKPQRKAS